MSEHGRIMCAVDLSWRSEGAFNYAVALAKSRHAPLEPCVCCFAWISTQLASTRARRSACHTPSARVRGRCRY